MNKKQRDEFRSLLEAIRQCNPQSNLLDFVIKECQDFYAGEEPRPAELALDILMNNLYEANLYITEQVHQSLFRLCMECGVDVHWSAKLLNELPHSKLK